MLATFNFNSINKITTTADLVIATTQTPQDFDIPGYWLIAYESFKQLHTSVFVKKNKNYQYSHYTTNNFYEYPILNIYLTINNALFVVTSIVCDTLTDDVYDQMIYYIEEQHDPVEFYILMAKIPSPPYIDEFAIGKSLNTTYELTPMDPVATNGLEQSFKLTIKPKVLCFSWNTDKTPLCDQYYNDKVHYRSKWWWQDVCYKPEFFEEIKEKLKERPDLAVFSTEGDPEKATFFHAEFLKTQMRQLGYQLLNNIKLNDIGYEHTSIRLSIYTLNHQYYSLNTDSFTCYKRLPTMLTSKAMVNLVDSPMGVIAFMSVQMDHHYDVTAIAQCMEKMQDALIHNDVSYAFIMGDFSLPGGRPASTVWDTRLFPFTEYQEGDIIFPNYQVGRDIIAWHNRIFFIVNEMSSHDINVLSYETMHGYPMMEGDSIHAGVLGLYQLTPVSI